MSTGGEEKVGYSLVDVGTLKLEEPNEISNYNSIVICQNKIIVLDINDDKVKIYRLHDRKFLDMLDSYSTPRDICLMDATTICVLHDDGLIKMASIKSENVSPVFTRMKRFFMDGVFDYYHSVVRVNDNIVVVGVKQDTTYWCIVSLDDGHVDTIHQICKESTWSYVTTKDNIIYISCYAGVYDDDTGVYAFDILKPSQCKYKYIHQRLRIPTSIVINEDGNIFVGNYEYFNNSYIHQLTASCQLVAIFTQEIPRRLQAMFWDNGRLYVTCRWSLDITVFHHVYQESHKESEVLVSHERKLPGIEESAIYISQGNVDNGQSSVETETPPSGPSPEDSEDEKQDPLLPVEILSMDDNSIQLYKKALHAGKEKVYNIRVMVVGQFGVGKTTLIKRLLGQPVDISERKSTEGIDVHKHCCKISLYKGEWIQQVGDSDQLHTLNRLIKLLPVPDQKPDISQEQEGIREVNYQREITSEIDATKSNVPSTTSVSDQEVQSSTQVSITREYKIHHGEHLDKETDILAVPRSDAKSSESEKKTKDAMMEILRLVNEKADKLVKDIEKYAALSLWDFAGQYAFYTTHQMFLTSRAIYLLVIDLSQQITDDIKDDKCFLDADGIILRQVFDLFQIWMNSIHSIVKSPKDIVPVIVVGTHVDKIPEKSRKEFIDKYFEELRYMLKEKPTICHLMSDIAIDNTQPDTQPDPMLEKLRKRIFKLSKQQPHWGEEKPARWLPLEQAIMTLKASGTKIVPLSLIEEINMSGSVKIEDRNELELFLKFHHDIGTILHFSVEELRENIVLDTQWIIDALKSLITAKTFIKKYPSITRKFYEFIETGKLTHELIDAIWSKENNLEFHNHKDHILRLMEQLNIIAKPRIFSEEAKETKEECYFLAPCMLQEKMPEEIISPKPNSQIKSSPVLCYVFTGNFLPSAIFHRLVAACIAHWPVAKKKKEHIEENLIFCGCCVFQLDEQHKMTLHFREHVIYLRVTRMGIKDKTPSSKLCIEVREFLTINLLKIIGYLGQGLKFEYFIQCPEYNGVSINSLIPVSRLETNAEVHCEFHDNMIESWNVLDFWFEDQEQTVNEGIEEGKESKVSEKGEDASMDRVLSTSIKKGVPCSDPKLLCQLLQKSQQAACSIQSVLEANCLSVGLVLHGETPANGNCFFEAVSSQLRRLNCVVQKSPQQLRQEVVAFMKTNRVIQASEGTIHLDSFIYNESFDVYCSRMAMDGEWADHVAVVAMARMLKMDIMIVTSSPLSGPEHIVWVVGQASFQEDPILLGHIWESHYMSLQPITPVVLNQDLAGHSTQAQTDVPTPFPTAEIMQITASGSTSSTAVGLIQAPTTNATPSLTSITAGVMQTTTSSFIRTDLMQASTYGSTTAVMQAPTSVDTKTNVLFSTTSASTPSTTTGSTTRPTPTSTTAVVMQDPSSGLIANVIQTTTSGSTAANVIQSPTSGPTVAHILQSTASGSKSSTTAGLTPVMSSWYTAGTLLQPQASSSIQSTTADVTQAPSLDDTARFVHIACLLVNVGSKVLRRLLHFHMVTPSCTLDQYLAKKKIDIDNLRKRKILNKSQIDILFPPGGSTNLGDYDITLLSALFTNIVLTISHQDLNMIQFLRDKRNEIFAHAKSVTVNSNDYHTFWNDICGTLEALSKQCNDPDFENEISREIQGIQVSTVQGTSLLDALQMHKKMETLERLVQYLMSSHGKESNKESDSDS